MTAMADSIVADRPRPSSLPALQIPDTCELLESDSLLIPPLDPFLDSQNYDMDDNNFDLEFNFDGLGDLYFTSENDSFPIPNQLDCSVAPLPCVDSNTTQSSADRFHSADQKEPLGDCTSYIPVSASLESGNPVIYVDRSGSPTGPCLNCSSEESGDCGQNHGAPASSFKVSSPLSSQDSRKSGSAVSEARNSPSTPNSGNFVVDQKVKEEGASNKAGISKRKKEISDDTSEEWRISKYQRSDNSDNANSNEQFTEEDEKRRARLMRNRESAQLSRQRKKHYVEELEDKVRSMHSTIAEMNGKISYFMAENASLRQQLSSSGICQPPPPGMYPQMGAPMGYPWVPCAPYVVKPQGSQMPLVPIPRLKPQQPVPSTKVKRTDSKKSEGKSKKVASISFLGLLFFIFIFGGLVPIINVRFNSIRDSGSIGSSFDSHGSYDHHRGRVLHASSGHLNSSHESLDMGCINGKSHVVSIPQCERDHTGGSQPLSNSDEFANLSNSSEPLVASLYVPRNDKLVKIDGNLIIHSIMASERAVASRTGPEKKNNEETGLAIPRDLVPALAIPDVSSNKGRNSHVYRSHIEGQRALTSGSDDALKDKLKSSTTNGKMQQWFREGLAGPMLSSGLCTEVFQFDISPASAAGAIIPASSVRNISADHNHNGTRPNNKGKHRRILHGLPLHFQESSHKNNTSGEHTRRNEDAGNLQAKKSVSSMVVSVLADPRESGDSDVDGMMAKSLSQIFVVVLLDRVKYVTYSCGLPRAGPHLVTT